MKTVTYMDKQFEVPNWATHIAADANGEVWIFDAEPYWRGGINNCWSVGPDNAMERVGELHPLKHPIQEI
jgi:hypothetical protein